MKRLWMVMCLLIGAPVFAEEEKAAESKTVSFADTPAENADAPAVATGLRRKFTDREARRLGFTLGSVRSAVKDLKASGDIDSQTSTAEMAAQVAEHIANKKENAAAFKAGAIDWESLISFIEKLLNIILKFFP